MMLISHQNVKCKKRSTTNAQLAFRVSALKVMIWLPFLQFFSAIFCTFFLNVLDVHQFEIFLCCCRYFMVGPTAQQTRSFAWLKDHLPKDGSVVLSDVTSMYTSLDVIGPKAQELLSELTDTPLNKQDFMHMTCKVSIFYCEFSCCYYS